MKFTVSTINPQPRTPLLVLVYNEERVLVNTPNTYEELERVARVEFSLADENLIFHTRDLDICEEKDVRIHKGAWDIVRSLTGNISVTTTARAPLGADSDLIVSNAAAYRVPGALEPLGEDDVLASARTEQNVMNSLPSPHSSSIHSRHDPRQADPSLKDQALTSDSDGSDDASMRIKSPKKRQLLRQVMSDDEDDSDHPMGEPDEPDDHDDDESGRSVFEDIPKRRDQGPVIEPAPSREQPKFPKVKEEPISGGMSFQKEKTPLHKKSGNSHVGKTTGVQEENVQESASNHTNDEKLLVSIAHRPTKQQAIFKTKGQTRVGKVLSGACKSFNLDYESARLLLIVTMEEDGETLEHFFECDKEETMTRVGAEKASSFIVETT
ncbi:hypothetical protein SERLA73DRAFT_71567 [Serpula lacrymans var. lacrymans S7.3]|uniref:Uncharacterized protein n=2 Tax=Serpula lacrymans var. lacrymans TaxID=341189 RepID=F8PRD4_SERL3|nr:uncharacterized protein SERLADRAFT_462808 [Serpula lacrymans var. lacrymans S7.9]EGO00557.1 hypothetical protein SERLA73DRAFT_71567 [Serpula lacrymans var. lacrymans S7.3]EGO26110.1 hypothetical protein SERLADRAFT_462808 [Serpula lacrymans var. lacrymans S7.9]